MSGGKVECVFCHELVYVSDYHSNCSNCGKRLHVPGATTTQRAKLEDSDALTPDPLVTGPPPRRLPPVGESTTVQGPPTGESTTCPGVIRDGPAPGRVDTGYAGAAPPTPEFVTVATGFGGPPAGGRATLIFERGPRHFERHELNTAMSIIGRDEAFPRELKFPLDDLLSASHATFTYSGNRLVVRDNGSLNGVYLKVEGQTPLTDGQQILMGSLLFRFESLPAGVAFGDPGEEHSSRQMSTGLRQPAGKLVAVDVSGHEGLTYELPAEKTLIGREGGTYTFPWDRRLSARHAQFELIDGVFMLENLSQANGTFLRIVERVLEEGDVLRIGAQLIRVEYE